VSERRTRGTRAAVVVVLAVFGVLLAVGSQAGAHMEGAGPHPGHYPPGTTLDSLGIDVPDPPQLLEPPRRIGRWSEPRNVNVVGIHAALLRTGKVLLFAGRSDQNRGSHARLLDPRTGALETVDVPFDREHFCSGHTILPDGRLLVAGGEGDQIATDGPSWVTLFDPATETWSKADSMARGRYYPSLVELPGGRAIAVSGTPPEGGSKNVKVVERYDPDAGKWSPLPRSANIRTGTYPRLLVLGNGKVFRAGAEQDSSLFDPATKSWSYVDRFNFGPRTEGAAVLLPGLKRVLAAGGSRTLAPSNRSAEVIDFAHRKPSWRYTGAMNRPRMNANLVLTADGKVLAVGGGLGGIYGPPVLESELYSPGTEKWRLMDAQRAPRDYHSTAILLPDGRILSAGQNVSPWAGTIEYFRPPYLFRGPRPKIRSAPKAVGYGERFTIETPDAAEISRVALVKPGTATHSVNFDQRYVDLSYSNRRGVLKARVPSKRAKAPPGYYMLFILDSEGVPAVAKFVRVG
jgi:hypothetical protein